MKNIWILNHYAITSNMPGGTRHYDFGKELVKRGYGVSIFASSFHYSQHKELKLTGNERYKVENIEGMNFVWIKTFPYQKSDWRRVLNMISFMWRAYWIGRKIIKENKDIKTPDIIIGSSVHLLATLSAYWLAKHYKVKFIMEVRDLWPQTLIDIGQLKENGFLAKVLRILENFLYKKAERIIILSPLAENYLLNLNIKTDKIHLIPNGINISGNEVIPDRIAAKENSQDFNIMYTGIIGTFVDLGHILLSAKKLQEKGLKNIRFILVGDGAEKRKLIEKSKRLELTNIKFLNSLPKKEVPFILRQADVLLLITGKVLYGSENKLMDYLASGKPIIFSTFGEHNITQVSNCGIRILPQNLEALTGAILKIYKMSTEERKKMGQNGKRYVEKYRNIPILVNKLEKVIQEIVNE